MKYHILFFQKLGKMTQNSLSVAVVIAALRRLAPWNRFKPSSKMFLLTIPRRYFFCGSFTLFMSCLVHALASVHCCLEVTCWERADILALVCDVLLCFGTCPCGILGQVWYLIVYRFLISAAFLTLKVEIKMSSTTIICCTFFICFSATLLHCCVWSWFYHVVRSSFNPYPTNIFVLKIVYALYVCCIYSSALQTKFYHSSEHCGPWEQSDLGSYCLQ